MIKDKWSLTPFTATGEMSPTPRRATLVGNWLFAVYVK